MAKETINGRITAFYALSLPEFHMNYHSHESCEIMYVTGGSCTVYCKDKTYRLTANQFIFIRSHIPHRLEIIPDKPCAILNLEFSLSETERGMPLHGLVEGCEEFRRFLCAVPRCFCGTDVRDLGYSLKDLISHIQRAHGSDDYLLSLIFARTMAELAYSIAYSNNESGVIYLRKACSYIDKNLHSAIMVPEIARYLGISKSYLQALFSEIMGCSIVEYVTQKRMKEAVFLLVNSTLRITDIAFSVGYNSRQHFAHTFEKYYGMSPMAYRQTHMRVLMPDTERKRYKLDDGKISLQNM